MGSRTVIVPTWVGREAFCELLTSLEDEAAGLGVDEPFDDTALRARVADLKAKLLSAYDEQRSRADKAEAENARLSAYKDRLRGECVGALTEAGIYMLVSPEDPTGPGEVSSAIERLAAERDSFLTSYDNLDHRHTEMTERADKAEAERDAALLAIVSCPACMKRTGAALEALGEK